MTWEEALKDFEIYLRLERRLSPNTYEAYLRDVHKLQQATSHLPNGVETEDVSTMLRFLVEIGISSASQARIISGLRTFFEFLERDNLITTNPMHRIELPKIGRHLPDTLEYHEIDKILNFIDLSTPEGIRNRSILETLYSSGLRVSELVNLEWSKVNLKEKFLVVVGKGNKQRMVPLGGDAKKYLEIYFNEIRCHFSPKKTDADIVYLNRRGGRLSRQMIFYIVKGTALEADIKKDISPHTFRHSFATHLVEGGADLRVVQDLLGHESILTTEIYTHLDKEYLSQTIAQYHPRSS